MDFCGSKRRGTVPILGPVWETKTGKALGGNSKAIWDESKMTPKQSPSPVGKKRGSGSELIIDGRIKKGPGVQIRKTQTLPLPPGNQIQDDADDNSAVLRKLKSEPVKNLEKSPRGSHQPCKELVLFEEIPSSRNGDHSCSNEPPIAKEAPLVPDNPNPTEPDPSQVQGSQTPQTKLQSLNDLIMWRDVPKSSLVFGVGVFAVVSSSYTWEINISFISVVSYICLVYLAAVFLFRSLICRGVNPLDETEQQCLVKEEDAVRLTKMVLPYLNEFLLNLRALFSGDPPTTMKLALLLFILARSGGSITIWKLAKLGFLGIFTVPKVCSAYSPQLASFGTFWVERFGDAWRSCSHKKAIVFGIFTLIWNISSIVARIWTLFMLLVSFKCYQQCSIKCLGELQHEEEDMPENKSKLVEENNKIATEQ